MGCLYFKYTYKKFMLKHENHSEGCVHVRMTWAVGPELGFQKPLCLACPSFPEGMMICT